jgi:hypothetical protein
VFKFVFAALSGLSQPLIGPLLAGIAASDPGYFGWLSGSWVQTALGPVRYPLPSSSASARSRGAWSGRRCCAGSRR